MNIVIPIMSITTNQRNKRSRRCSSYTTLTVLKIYDLGTLSLHWLKYSTSYQFVTYYCRQLTMTHIAYNRQRLQAVKCSTFSSSYAMQELATQKVQSQSSPKRDTKKKKSLSRARPESERRLSDRVPDSSAPELSVCIPPAKISPSAVVYGRKKWISSVNG